MKEGIDWPMRAAGCDSAPRKRFCFRVFVFRLVARLTFGRIPCPALDLAGLFFLFPRRVESVWKRYKVP
jgi:hypothetical protein